MALCGLIGIGTSMPPINTGYPPLVPCFPSITVIVGRHLSLQLGEKITNPQYIGGLVWLGNPGGAVLQWLVQVPAQWRSGMGTLRLRFDFNQPGVRK